MSKEKQGNRLEGNQPTQVIGPEGLLLRAVFGIKKTPIPPEFAKARKEAVDEALKTLTARERHILSLVFGFATGRPQTLAAVAKQTPRIDNPSIHITYQVSSSLVTKALSKLRHPTRSSALSLFLPLSDNSLGKSVWGINFGYELLRHSPCVDIANLDVEEMNLSDETLEELRNKGILFPGTKLNRLISYPPNRLPLAIRRKPNSSLSESARSELIQSL
ncbi:hypothetical protein A2697_03790 [Candidatus Curtissbacteria bacterium RIFCSPHIGHO2_01_FULL_41_44]|uniref:RNA polymerase sigma-70 region 4 domain-containing protein n=1 Tax=Candidatus Curtissbacteria bacterium RIFCSPLOWO2_01_FULL_42_50 TaxID=1797730 RepID=A0A1F5H7K0_9BACT|nr:MAG: hypothetical protein A2697_03790 [Candidatus Curtissbacteria bacterium RIFCSPHIGHO2_01_FULL_41_44]OGD94288.1 MAG: hypothetical protein A3C33_02950 [Candidatus Curtissbacteria bacterium RIFCSPHIGHO2_02_FULL_42_58]OGD97762.1 MAG: hypothetical protein A3E71_03460 [Candidatus Curtissbacteria bacterium RIFCSPHIGHO2_12_FULL_42_33]OGE00154.1 MAG: hypothetical protein A3B54_02005 [Candidatus Curtissbacteria bacterium RIFCSPLOWO2_01_FULL_42_50]OGE02080.1 MAG: hypothetical protein A3G16_00315 [Ca